jgi:pimeloyl-ACP methyl ester carboxylesterase
MSTARVNGVELYWELTGEMGEPLVLVHGSWTDHHAWDRVVPLLSRSFRVLAYDRRGHSRSERTAGQGSIREDAGDLVALVEHLDLAPANVAAISFGAAIALRTAADRPDVFRRLLVHEPPLFDLLEGDEEAAAALSAARERMEAAAERLTAGDMEEGTRLFVETIAMGPGGWDRLSDQMKDTFVFNAPTWLDEIRDPGALSLDLSRLRGFGPTLLTAGANSPSFFRLVVDAITRNLPRSEVRVFAGAGHVPHVSHSAEYVEVATSFFTRPVTEAV